MSRGRGTKEMFYLTTHSTHFIYGYMASGMVKDHSDRREDTRCRHVGYSFRLAAMVLLYASSHRQDNTYHSLCYTSRGALAGMRNSSMGPRPEDEYSSTKQLWPRFMVQTVTLFCQLNLLSTCIYLSSNKICRDRLTQLKLSVSVWFCLDKFEYLLQSRNIS